MKLFFNITFRKETNQWWGEGISLSWAVKLVAGASNDVAETRLLSFLPIWGRANCAAPLSNTNEPILDCSSQLKVSPEFRNAFLNPVYKIMDGTRSNFKLTFRNESFNHFNFDRRWPT